MQIDQIKTLFSYHWAMTVRLIEGAAQIEESIYKKELDYGRGSVHDLLFHILAADHSWRIALQSGRQQPGLDNSDFPDLDSVHALLEDEERAWQEYFTDLTDAALQEEVSLTSLRGHTRNIPLWRVLVHLVLHGMQHQSELSRLLTEQDQSPGDIDFIFFSE